MTATYDLSSPVGQTRIQIPDTDMASPIFTDAEIEFFLDRHDGNTSLAAAMAIEVIATDSERLVQFTRNGVSGTRTDAATLQQRAHRMRLEALPGIEAGKVLREDFW